MPATAQQADQAYAAVVRLVKVAVSSHRQAPRVHDRVDQAALGILFKLLEGPRRVSTLAELSYTDTSTTSRHVSNLVRQGLAAKTPDPDDRRAFQVALSPAGRDLVCHAKAASSERMRHVLAGWAEADVDHLLAALSRLADDLEASLTATTPTENP